MQFFRLVSADNSTANVDDFFLHCLHGAIFLLMSADDSIEGEKSSLSRFIFETELHSAMWKVDTALSDPVCSTQCCQMITVEIRVLKN